MMQVTLVVCDHYCKLHVINIWRIADFILNNIVTLQLDVMNATETL